MTRIGRRAAMAAALGTILGLVAVPAIADGANRADVTGTYKWSVERNGQTFETTLKLRQDGEKLTGTVSGRQGTETAIEDAKVTGDEVTFKVTRTFGDNKIVQKFKAKVTAESMKGTIETERNGNTATRDFEAKRS